jgi:hypothetical protein
VNLKNKSLDDFIEILFLEECFIDKGKSSKCSSGVCSGKYSSSLKDYFFECHPNSEASVEVHITTNMIIKEGNNLTENQIIRYNCKFNQCNNQFLTDQLINIVDKYFYLSSMRDALLFPYKTTETTSRFGNSSDQTTFTTEKQGSSSTTATSTTVRYSIASKCFPISIILISILLIIFI